MFHRQGVKLAESIVSPFFVRPEKLTIGNRQRQIPHGPIRYRDGKMRGHPALALLGSRGRHRLFGCLLRAIDGPHENASQSQKRAVLGGHSQYWTLPHESFGQQETSLQKAIRT
jgi:hypothetical protein